MLFCGIGQPLDPTERNRAESDWLILHKLQTKVSKAWYNENGVSIYRGISSKYMGFRIGGKVYLGIPPLYVRKPNIPSLGNLLFQPLERTNELHDARQVSLSGGSLRRELARADARQNAARDKGKAQKHEDRRQPSTCT